MVLTLQNSSFSEAKNYFQKFLIQQNLSDDLLWLFLEDIIPQEDGLLVKVPIPFDNDKFAERCYEVGRERGLGVCFYAFALLNSHPCCYIQLPSDEIDAEHMLINNLDLKCSVRTDLLKAKPVNSSLSWSAYKLNYRLSGTRAFLPQNMPHKNCRL